MSIPNLHTTINYEKLIKIQANQTTGKSFIKKQESAKQKTYIKRITKK